MRVVLLALPVLFLIQLASAQPVDDKKVTESSVEDGSSQVKDGTLHESGRWDRPRWYGDAGYYYDHPRPHKRPDWDTPHYGKWPHKKVPPPPRPWLPPHH